MKKLLYIDVPFAKIAGGDTNRSNMIWSGLSKSYHADLLLIKTEAYKTKAVPEHSGYQNLYTLATTPAPYHAAAAIHHFHSRQIQKFTELLRRGNYDIIVLRFLSSFKLARLAAQELPEAKIVIDVDMLFSRIAELAWERNKSLKNRYHYVQMLKLKRFERKAFSGDFSFFFTNNVERDLAITQYQLKAKQALIFPNMLQEYTSSPAIKAENGKYILFFGTLNSIANADAVNYLMQDIYPGLKTKLREQHIKLRIVGKNPLPYFTQYADDTVQIVGPVEDMQSEIAGAMMILLPLRVASGTRTRILEAAIHAKAVITTGIGAEGFAFSEAEIVIVDNALSFAQNVLKLIQDPELAESLGRQLKTAAQARYAHNVVIQDFLEAIDSNPKQVKAARSRLKIAIISNRFYPEVGGAETNIYYQARLLAQSHELTVICPKRIESPRIEQRDGFTIYRMADWINPGHDYPKLNSKTLCPSLVWHLLWHHYDIIQCFPALNYNNILAFWLAKLRGIPYILCFFDFIDYAAEIKNQGKIDPDILKSVKPKWYQLPVLKGIDQAFAIADKEISFLKRYNPNVKYSPVPVLSEEYEHIVPKPSLLAQWAEDSFVFLSLGRISYIKGQDIALQAFDLVADAMPEARLVFVGRTDYEPETFAKMQSFVSSHKLEERVFFTGMVERNEVLGWLRHSHIHVIPVRFMNSGAVVVESWISGTPVLQSDVVDPNLVQDGYNGYLFPSESVTGCAEKMLQAYRQAEHLASFAQRGKELVKSKYTYDYLIALYNSAYDNLLK